MPEGERVARSTEKERPRGFGGGMGDTCRSKPSKRLEKLPEMGGLRWNGRGKSASSERLIVRAGYDAASYQGGLGARLGAR